MDAPWVDYRRRVRAVWLGALLAFLWFVWPGAFITHQLVRWGMNPDAAFLLARALPALVCIVLPHFRRMQWPCPRCRRPFHVSWIRGNPFAGSCIHCGLPKGETFPVPADPKL